jgi:hypothetical protein
MMMEIDQGRDSKVSLRQIETNFLLFWILNRMMEIIMFHVIYVRKSLQIHIAFNGIC